MNEDSNPIETREWLDALDEVVRYEGEERASFLLMELAKHAIEMRLRLPSATVTPFRNTIPPEEEKMLAGDLFMERRIRSIVRWNALAMVMRANLNDEGLGGHISSFSSSAMLYDVGYNHFFRGTQDGHPGDRGQAQRAHWQGLALSAGEHHILIKSTSRFSTHTFSFAMPPFTQSFDEPRFVQPVPVLNEQAQKRLATIQEYQELGSGFKECSDDAGVVGTTKVNANAMFLEQRSVSRIDGVTLIELDEVGLHRNRFLDVRQ